MDDISIGISILTAMITPAILIVACGSLSLTTSQRLNRSLESARKISVTFNEINEGRRSVSIREQEMLRRQLEKSARRAVLLQRAMTMLYTALGFFILTSLIIGLFEIISRMRSWLLVILPMLGAIALLWASILLIMETRLALKSVDDEMYFRLKSSAGVKQNQKETH
jgi:uncharacterized membrane protein YqjE